MHFVGIPTLIIFSFATKFWLFLILVSNSLYFSSNFEFGTIHRWFDDPFWPTLLFNESSYNPSTNTSMQSIIWWNLSLINSYLYQSSYSKCRNIVLLLLSVIFPYNSTLNSASPVWLLKRGFIVKRSRLAYCLFVCLCKSLKYCRNFGSCCVVNLYINFAAMALHQEYIAVSFPYPRKIPLLCLRRWCQSRKARWFHTNQPRFQELYQQIVL